MKRLLRFLSFMLAISMLSAALGGSSFAAGKGDFTVVNGVLTSYKGTGGDVVIPGDLGITAIGISSFSNHKNIRSVTIPEGVKEIYGYAFQYSSLEEINLPSGLWAIGSYAFHKCENLTSLYIPGDVIAVASNAFSYCKKLKSVVVAGGTVFDYQAFCGCEALEKVSLAEGLGTISRAMFADCRSLSEITIPESVFSIDSAAFSGCTALKEIVIPKRTAYIGDSAFYYCTSLKSVKILSDNIELGSHPFMGSGLEEPVIINKGTLLCFVPNTYTSYTVPEGVTSIGYESFKGNYRLDEVVFSPDLRRIGNGAFQDCHNLRVVVFSEGLKEIGANAFYNCGSLKSISLPKSLVSVGVCAFSESAFESPVFSHDGKSLYFVPNTYTEYSIPDGVTEIGPGAFWSCPITMVTLPKGLETIGEKAFSECHLLTEIIIPDSVTSIGEYAFIRCTKLESIKIPEGVSEISKGAFSECLGLKTVTLPESCGIIREYAFSGCKSLASVKIPSTVRPLPICESAFSGCSSLRSVYIPDNVTSIAQGAFSGCVSLTSVYLPESLFNIGDHAFSNCSALDTVIIKGKYTEFDKTAFEGCRLLTLYSESLNYVERFAVINNIPFKPIVRIAVPSANAVIINGKPIELEAYSIDDNNYVKLRDIAAALSGTGKQFEVSFDAISSAITLNPGKPYTPVGGELTPSGVFDSIPSIFKLAFIYIDGVQYSLRAYEIGGYNYVKLRDIASVTGFGVHYDKTNDSVVITA